MTPLDALKKSVHCVPAGRHIEMILDCHKCGEKLPHVHFKKLSENRGVLVSTTKSSGSFIQYLHPWCDTCRKVARRHLVRHPLYSKEVGDFFFHRMHSLKAGAKARNIVVALDHDDILRASLNQGNRCAITRLPMTFAVKGDDLKGRSQASVDRIDSRWNYTLDNIQIVCAVVNMMKNNMQTHEFLRWCALVLDGRRKAEMEILDATAG